MQAATTVEGLSMTVSDRASGAVVTSGSALRTEQPAADGEEQRDAQEHQPELGQRALVHVGDRLGELVGDHARPGWRRCRAASARMSGLLPITMVTAMVSPSARPRREHRRAPEAAARAYGSTPCRIISQRVAPERVEALALRLRHAAEHLERRARPPSAGPSRPGRRRPPACPTPMGGPVKNGEARSPASTGSTCRRSQRHEHEEPPQAVDDAGDGGEHLDGKPRPASRSAPAPSR